MNIKAYKTHIKTYAPIIFWGLVAFVTGLFLVEDVGILPTSSHLDKIFHTCLFTMLTLVGYLAYMDYKKWLYISLAIYGATTEIMQEMFTNTRFASIHDWLADLTGILIAALLIKIVINNFNVQSCYDNRI
ncbi:MAG TPA: VanZ family protein [Methylophilaceae bacterium]|nr:VanZ family protein [Methylophilaceae bacterium]